MNSFDVLIGAALCFSLLATGLWVGWRMPRFTGSSAPVLRPSWMVLHDDQTAIRSVMSQWLEMRLRSSELLAFGRAIGSVPQEIPPEWKTELIQLLRELYEGLESKLQGSAAANPSSTSHPRRASTADGLPTHKEQENADVLTNAQLLELLAEQELGCHNDEESGPPVRYKFSAKQPMATVLDNGPLQSDSFAIVQIHDLSVKNIRYFVDDMPGEGNVVVGLGLPTPVKWISAEVEDFRRAFMYGRVGYLVTARLLACIDTRAHTFCEELEHSGA